jgi:hypothetical protein
MFAVALALIGFGLIIYLEKSASKNNLV